MSGAIDPFTPIPCDNCCHDHVVTFSRGIEPGSLAVLIAPCKCGCVRFARPTKPLEWFKTPSTTIPALKARVEKGLRILSVLENKK